MVWQLMQFLLYSSSASWAPAVPAPAIARIAQSAPELFAAVIRFRIRLLSKGSNTPRIRLARQDRAFHRLR